jgi:hypothetical protein
MADQFLALRASRSDDRQINARLAYGTIQKAPYAPFDHVLRFHRDQRNLREDPLWKLSQRHLLE